MTEQLQVYKCEICGNMVETLRSAQGTLVCCNQKMTLLTANTVDAAREKHVPVIENTADGVKVSVGSIAHPMEDKHFIEWIEVIADGRVYRKHLRPGDAPEATFAISANMLTAREFCNLHGLWKGESE